MTSQMGFWSEEHLAKTSVLQDSEQDWAEIVATYPRSLSNWLTTQMPLGFSGRTCLEYSVAEVDKTLQQSLVALRGARYKLQKTDGRTAESSKEQKDATPLHGESLTLNISEWPSDADVCLLSDTLEAGNIPQRYYLSGRGCRGILRRAEKRGKELPEMLKVAYVALTRARHHVWLPTDLYARWA